MNATGNIQFDEIGSWSELKLEIVEKYGAAYTTAFAGQKGRGLRKYYIDAFSGAGIHLSKLTGRQIEGSPARALKVRPAFDHFYFTLLKPGIAQEDRQKILTLMDVYTRADPAENVRNRDIATTLSLLLGSVPPVASAISPTDPWKLGWAARGRYFEDQLGRTLHPNFPTIDKIPDGIATSMMRHHI